MRFIGDGVEDKLAYRQAAEDNVARDRLANILIDRSNAICQSELALLMQNQAEVGGWLGIATTGLATASTVVTGDLAKSILSGGAAFTSGSADQISSFAYKDTLIEVINTAIREKRALALETIVAKFGRTNARYTTT
ncbi:hypothetical protein [Croceicoccus hydrothermalis]|uniref:hypothetical protein n=1 Tax=Croceicoccus hydrothermalis TaxID=2867964 RepID=UPI001EFAF239|nr:hypothetical protein [Croceicoccus hydrothermalis]